MVLRPFFLYYGAKWRVAPYYPAPQYETIIEPLAGAAGYSLRHWQHRVLLCDADEYVRGTWAYLLRATPEEIMRLPDVSKGQRVDELALPQEAQWLIGWWLNAGVTSPRKTPSGFSSWGPSIRQRIARQLCFIRHWQLLPYNDYRQCPDIVATWFIDPPYEKMGHFYRHGSKRIHYADLARWCQRRQGQVIVCEAEGATWLPFRPFRAVQGTLRTANEVVWCRRRSSSRSI
jgi:hypothetical protein